MHNLVKFAAAVAVGVSVCACSGGGAHIGFEEKEYEKDCIRAHMRLAMLEGEGEFCRGINDAEQRHAQEMLDELIARGEEAGEAELSADSFVAADNGRLVSVVTEGEAFFGGARAEKFRYCRTMDVLGEKEFELSDVFADDGWRNFADARMRELAQSGEEEYKDLWEMPSAELLGERSFYIKRNKIVFYFEPYALSYYRKGYVEFEFPLEDFLGYFSEDFKTALSA